jgi:hypothetical protein
MDATVKSRLELKLRAARDVIIESRSESCLCSLELIPSPCQANVDWMVTSVSLLTRQKFDFSQNLRSHRHHSNGRAKPTTMMTMLTSWTNLRLEKPL